MIETNLLINSEEKCYWYIYIYIYIFNGGKYEHIIGSLLGELANLIDDNKGLFGWKSRKVERWKSKMIENI